MRDSGVGKKKGSEFVNKGTEIDGERWECEPDCGNLTELGKLSYKDEEAVVRTFVAEAEKLNSSNMTCLKI